MTRMLAPAKLTLTLTVTGVRADGLHELRAEMVALSLADELTITEGGDGLSVEAGPGTRAESLALDEGNLITRALAAVGRTAAVHVVKRIPLGGGLGGGSTDAAAVLRWAGCADAAVALALGSDVPFSLRGGRALVEGVGERVTPLDFVPRWFTLLVPPFGVDTARVYATWDEAGGLNAPEVGSNGLTAAALAVEPRLAGWRDALGEHTGKQPLLAGSGSTWFVEDAMPPGGHRGEGEPDEGGEGDAAQTSWLSQGGEQALLVRAHTVPVDWDGPAT
ncbi:MAG TPA: 4-(cytidine 5'-diphospho)-2-C-methyl-D-erythritol kinase [Acidimicrobiales bacterium]|nr:4-(cytidine 5'-diphospho)-2-C-methyl-D-erythritol kinase [Acidimicrobiales bacterium]